MPYPSSFDMQLGKSTTPVEGLFVFQSVENVSGQNPAFMIAPTVSHLMCPFCPFPRSNQTPRRLAASTSGRTRPLSSTTLFGGGANMWVTMSPRFKSANSRGSGETVCPMWIIRGIPNDEATSCARRSTS
jgi:hypothetical protein